jgi:hypothetical protein
LRQLTPSPPGLPGSCPTPRRSGLQKARPSTQGRAEFSLCCTYLAAICSCTVPCCAT